MSDDGRHHHHIGRDGEHIVLFDDHPEEAAHKLRVQWLNKEGFPVKTIETPRLSIECSTGACPLRRYDS